MFICAGTVLPEYVQETEAIVRVALLGMKYRELYTDHLWKFMQEELAINEWVEKEVKL